jgi:hypothetical protein
MASQVSPKSEVKWTMVPLVRAAHPHLSPTPLRLCYRGRFLRRTPHQPTPSGGGGETSVRRRSRMLPLLHLLRQFREPDLPPHLPSAAPPPDPTPQKTSRLIRAGRVVSTEAEREGLEPPSPFGRSLSRRVHYHSASAPEWEAGIGAPGFEPGTSASRTQRSTGLSHAPNKKTAPFEAPRERTGWDSNPRDSIRCPHALQACALSRSATRPNATKTRLA